MEVRINKYLANQGIAARRKCDEYIEQGLVKVNGKIVTRLGTKIDPSQDVVTIDQKVITEKPRSVYYLLNKPVGHVCSVTGPESPKVVELFKHMPERVFPVGRLDKLTSGMLIMTNDGNFSYTMTHPKFEKEKEYVVKVREKVTKNIETILKKPFFIQGRLTQVPVIHIQSPHLFHVILKEGRNRQIRRMCTRANLIIEKLKRVRIGKITLGKLKPGEFRELSKEELGLLAEKR